MSAMDQGSEQSSLLFEVISFGTKEHEEALSLRNLVLRKPLGLSFSQADLQAESQHIHLVGVLNKEVVATAILVPQGQACKMRQVAVKEGLTNKGIGSKMLAFCESHARLLGFSSLYCHARKAAVGFYLRNGYVGEGGYFDEVGIPHLKMRKVMV